MSATARRLSFRDRLLVSAGGALGPLLVRALGSTWRVTVLHAERVSAARGAAGPVVFAFWHGTLLPLEYINRARGICVLSSWHRDGELSARVMTGLGYRVVRGSTSRGAARGLQLLVRGVREGRDVAVTPDGPRGPALSVQTGALYIARRAGVPVVPVGVAASHALRLGSWDRFTVPLPFSRVVVAHGEPLPVATDGPLGGDREALEARLAAATEEADRVSRGGGTPSRSASPSAAYRAYRLISRVVGALGTPLLSVLAARRVEWRQRLGDMPGVRPGGVWVHAASVGEVAAASPIVAALQEGGTQVLLTVVTPTGFEAAARLAGPRVSVAFAPLDLVRAVGTALDAVRPRALLLVETELWPNLIAEACLRGVAVGVVNGRLSARSARRYASPWSPVRGPAAGLAFAACQTERDAASFSAIGVRREAVAVTGNTKFETAAAPPSDAERDELRRSLGLHGSGPVIVFGSVRPREERAVAEAAAAVARDRPDARFLVAPRHLGRVDAVARRLADAGLSVALRSGPAQAPASAARALVLDTTGELGRAYGVGAAAFVGGTLAPYGGHNPLEPAALGVPVVIGPHVESCRDSADALVRAGAAVMVHSAAELAAALSRLIGDRDLRARASAAGLAVVASGRGAGRRTVALLTKVGVLAGAPGQRDTG